MAVYYGKNGTRVKKKDNIQNRARKSESDLRVNRVVAHVTKSEKEIIVKLAKENGMDTSTFIRCLCLMKYREMAGELVK